MDPGSLARLQWRCVLYESCKFHRLAWHQQRLRRACSDSPFARALHQLHYGAKGLRLGQLSVLRRRRWTRCV